jgi:2-polyprenyl-3-methyl-5-hydroxy-6-metoxy-1,4-benzoquinol methylase
VDEKRVGGGFNIAMKQEYIGDELETFRYAENWKQRFGAVLRPYVKGDVLEVGAGIGETTGYLFSDSVTSWVSLEPDEEMAKEAEAKYRELGLAPQPETLAQSLEEAGRSEGFDTAVYIDVLEHIEDDRGELERAAKALRGGGHLVVLSPAFQVLYSPFDERIGHYRRYTRKSLEAVGAGMNLELVESRYLDALGAMLSLGNRLLTRSPEPTLKQILFWDRRVLPMSRFIDPMLGSVWGRSVYAVWRKDRMGGTKK